MPRKLDSPAVAVLKKESAERQEVRRALLDSLDKIRYAAAIDALKTALRRVRAAEKSPWMPPADRKEG